MYRKGVSALITNNNNEFLLVNLVSFEEQYFAVPGGGVEGGETLEEAICREIKEELEIRKDFLELVGKSATPVQSKFKKIKLNRDGKDYEGMERYFFGFRFLGDESEIKLKGDEIRMYKWVSLKDLDKYLLFGNQLDETIEKIREIFP